MRGFCGLQAHSGLLAETCTFMAFRQTRTQSDGRAYPSSHLQALPKNTRNRFCHRCGTLQLRRLWWLWRGGQVRRHRHDQGQCSCRRTPRYDGCEDGWLDQPHVQGRQGSHSQNPNYTYTEGPVGAKQTLEGDLSGQMAAQRSYHTWRRTRSKCPSAKAWCNSERSWWPIRFFERQFAVDWVHSQRPLARLQNQQPSTKKGSYSYCRRSPSSSPMGGHSAYACRRSFKTPLNAVASCKPYLPRLPGAGQTYYLKQMLLHSPLIHNLGYRRRSRDQEVFQPPSCPFQQRKEKGQEKIRSPVRFFQQCQLGQYPGYAKIREPTCAGC